MDPTAFDHLTRRFARAPARRTSRRAAVSASLAVIALSAFGRVATGQATPVASPGPGATPAARGEKPVFMFVETFASGHGDMNPGAGTPAVEGTPATGGGASFLLTLEGHTGLTVYFSDRPERVVGAVPTGGFLKGFDFSPGTPPNAALVAEFPSGQGVAVLQLVEPTYDASAGSVTFGAEWLEGYKGGNLEPVVADQVAARLPAEFGPNALFIDDCADLVNCKRKLTVIIPDIVGPIPGGPYGQCWQGFGDWCQPCWESLTYLNTLCNDSYTWACDGDCVATTRG